ncbi:DUF4184 family protein [Streptomyces vinaceus]
MPFTLAHPAAVLPLLRRPFVPAALIAGAMAPDIPYFLGALGLSATSHTWYEPLTNATTSHSVSGIFTVDLIFTAGLLVLYRLLRGPVLALCPPAWGVQEEAPPATEGFLGYGKQVMWLLVSALIGIASHLAWDLVTDTGLLPGNILTYVNTAVGLAAIGIYLWRHRDRLRTSPDGHDRRSPAKRWSVVGALALAGVLGAVARFQGFAAYRYTTETNFDQPTTQTLPGGASITTYTERMVEASWGSAVQGFLYDIAKGAVAGLAVALLAYGIAWQVSRVLRRWRDNSELADNPA